MKKIIMLLLAASLVLALASCGEKAPSGAEQKTVQNTEKPASDSKTTAGARTLAIFGKLFSEKGTAYMKLRTEMDMETDKDIVTVSLSRRGEAEYIDMQGEKIGHSSILELDKVTYQISHIDKTVMKLPEWQEEPDIAEFFDEDYDDDTFTEGTETVNGTDCEYEETTDDGGTVRFYYPVGTDTLKFIKDGAELIEVLEYSDKVDESVFALPSDYEVMEMPDIPAPKQ